MTTAELWTTRKLLVWMRQAFTKKGLDSPGLMSELLMSHVLGCDRLKLHMDVDRPASDSELASLRDLVRRALNHEPVQYLTGEAWFYGMPMKSDRRALIPRPSTGTIVEEVLRHARAAMPSNSSGEGVFIADVCTGSGCIAIVLLKRLPGARAVATDVSADALVLARENAERHGVADRIEFLRGHLLDALDTHPVARSTGSISYLVSNPPYIPDHEWPGVAPNVKDHEPHLALRGGADGLDLVRPLLGTGAEFLRPGGMIAIEVADSTAGAALELAKANAAIESPRIVRDLEGLPRTIVGIRAEKAS